MLRDYPKMEGVKVKYYAKMAIRNLLHANSCVHSRRLIAEFPEDGNKCMEKLQSHCANMTFADKSRYDRIYVHFKLIYTTDHIFPVLPIKDLRHHTNWKQVRNLQCHIYVFYFVCVLYGKLRRTLRQRR